MKKIFSLFVAFLLVFNLLSPYVALAESTVETSNPDNFEVPIDIEDDTYELDHVNACLSDMFDLDEVKEEDLEDFDLDQLGLTEEDVLTLKDCLTLLLEEEKAANEEMATEEEEAVTEEEAVEDVVTEEEATEEEDVVTEEEATEEEDVVTEEEATEEEDVVTEEEATEEEDVVTEEEATEEEDVVTEKEATEEEDVVTEEEAAEEEDVVTEEEATEEEDVVTEEEATEKEDVVTEEEATEEEKVVTEEESAEDVVIEDEAVEDTFLQFSMLMKQDPILTNTSKLGHIYSKTKIYSELGNNTSINTANLINAVYYIKREAQYNGDTYYLLSTQPSATTGIIGWAKSSEVTSHAHTVVDKQTKTFQIKGTGNAYTKAWGGSKDLVTSLSKEKGKDFTVHLTEKVGNDTWYRGTLNNRTVWIHESYLERQVISNEKATSQLGHIYGSTNIYQHLGGNATISTTNLTNAVYYIKREAELNGSTYYLLSTQPSATNGTIGWAKSSEVTSHAHTVVDKQTKTFQIKGTGNAYTKAWGGSKDIVTNLLQEKGKAFDVHLTEKVGNDTWYRGTLSNRTVWIHESYLERRAVTNEKATSRLGHIYGSTKIYQHLSSNTTISTTNLTNAVYYIKREAQFNGSTYYLLSTQPSATNGTIGWAKSSEVTSHAHTVVDKQTRTFQIKGTGNAYTKAWGGSKDIVTNLSKEKGKAFDVHLTEKVGNNTWYRGTLNNRTVWIHESYLERRSVSNEKATSRLGHIYGSTKIYQHLGKSATISTTNLTHAVYYIKRETQYNGATYYLLSTKPSATDGTIGWAKSSEVTSHAHSYLDQQAKAFQITGSGSAYTKAWGGSKDLITNLSGYRGQTFNVHLTEKVGNNTWYRGTLNNQTVWIHSSYLSKEQDKKSYYNITLDQAANMQYGANAQTDRYSQYVHKDYVKKSGNTYTVNASLLNVRSGPGTSYPVVDQLANGKRLSIRGTSGSWYQLFWVDAKKQDIIYYLDPNNFINDKVQQFQFLDLAKTSGASETALNNYLRGKGILAGQGKAFIDAGRTHGINDVYLLSHALLETGNGSSTLAKGVKYNGVTVYNMYGIGAKDSCPIECGTKYAYDQGWTTPYKSIVGGAAFIGNSYVKSGQNSLYKMRWNPDAMVRNGRASHQYATDIGWASKQVHSMYNLYQGIGSYTLNLDIPVYK